MKKVIVYFLFIFVFYAVTSFSQNILLEKFVEADGLIEFVPMYVDHIPNKIDESRNYKTFNGKHPVSDWKGSIPLYDKEGNIWHEFVFNEDVLELQKDKKPDERFKPYYPYKSFEYSNPVVRIKGISDYYYEILINEKTEEPKYIKKSNSFVHYAWFDAYITFSDKISFNSKTNPIRETPNGRILEVVLSDDDQFRPKVWKMKGDWIEIVSVESKKYEDSEIKGWIRWKQGRKILVGYMLNMYCGQDLGEGVIFQPIKLNICKE